MKKTLWLTLLLLLVTVIPTFAQLKVTLNVSSRPDPYLSNWAQRKETVIVTIINSGSSPVRAKFDCKINKDGSLIVNTKPEKMKILDIPTGVSQYYGEDLVPLEAAKIKDGADQTAIKTGMLPAGSYEFCCSLLDPQDKQITPPVCKSFTLQSYQAPVLLQPEDKSTLAQNKRPMFRWTGVSPKPQFLVKYRLQVFEVLPGQTPMNAFRANRPILDRTDILATQYQWPADVEMPSPKLQHIWTVRAIDDKGNSIGEPYGYATPFVIEPCCFKYGDVCCPPDDKVQKYEDFSPNNLGAGPQMRGPKPSMGEHIDQVQLRTKSQNDSIKKTDEDVGGQVESKKCPDGTYPNPNSSWCGTPCQPCLGCCPCKWDPKQYCDLITGNMNIRNVHPEAYINNYVYVDGVMVPNDNIDISKGGTILMQKVHKYNGNEFIPSFLAGEEVIVTHQAKEIARAKIGSNGEYSFKIPAGIKNIDELEIGFKNESGRINIDAVCKVLANELDFRIRNHVLTSDSFWETFGLLSTAEVEGFYDLLGCDNLKAFISNPNLPDILNDFPVTTLPKFDKYQVRITQTEPFTWNTPEVIGALGYEYLTFPPGEYVVKKDPKSNKAFVELTAASSKKLTNPNSLSSAKMVPMCHVTQSPDCKNIGFGCLVMFPEEKNLGSGWKVSIVNEKDGKVTVRLDGEAYNYYYGTHKYFAYREDYVISDDEVVSKLGVKQLIIKSGTYLLKFTDNPNGDVVFDLAEPIGRQQFSKVSNQGTIKSAIFMTQDCKEEGTICFYHPGGNNPKVNLAEYKLSPIFDGETARRLKLSVVNWIIPPTNTNLNRNSNPLIPEKDVWTFSKDPEVNKNRKVKIVPDSSKISESEFIQLSTDLKMKIVDADPTKFNDDQPQSLQSGGGKCYCYIACINRIIVFPHDFVGSCAEACEFMKKLSERKCDWFKDHLSYVTIETDPIEEGSPDTSPAISAKATPIRRKIVKSGKNPGGSIVATKNVVDILCDAVVGTNVDVQSFKIVTSEINKKYFVVQYHNNKSNQNEELVFDLEDYEGYNCIMLGGPVIECFGCPECKLNLSPTNSYLPNCIGICNNDVWPPNIPPLECKTKVISLGSVSIEKAFDVIMEIQARGVQPDGSNDSDPRIKVSLPNPEKVTKEQFQQLIKEMGVKVVKNPQMDNNGQPQSIITGGICICWINGARSSLAFLSKSNCCNCDCDWLNDMYDKHPGWFKNVIDEFDTPDLGIEKDKDNRKEQYTNPDGTLKYFEYTSDYVITDKKLCEAFGVKELVIAPGVYHVEYSNPSNGGIVRFRLKIPIPAKQIRIKVPITIVGSYSKDQHCIEPGNSCFAFSNTQQSKKKLPSDSCIFTVTPLMPNSACFEIQVSFRGYGSPRAAGIKEN